MIQVTCVRLGLVAENKVLLWRWGLVGNELLRRSSCRFESVVGRWLSVGSRGKACCAWQSRLTGCFSISHRQRWGKIRFFLPQSETKQHWVCFFFNLFSDELRGVSLADEDFQQPQFGFDVLVFVVFHCQRGAVLLLHVSMGTRQQTIGTRWRRACGKAVITMSVLHSCSPVEFQQLLYLLTFRFVWRTAPRTLSGSCGVSSSLLGPLGAAPQVPVCKRKFGSISKSHTGNIEFSLMVYYAAVQKG